jgi:predicted enzyme related to lactoylglutathione lyase
MNTNPVGWFEIYVQDLERARKFYETVFSTRLQKLNAPFPGIELMSFPMNQESYGATGALVKMEGMNPGGNSTIIYFSCQDCAVEQSRAADAGGRIERPKMSIGEYGFISLIYDTEGNMIGLHSMQ